MALLGNSLDYLSLVLAVDSRNAYSTDGGAQGAVLSAPESSRRWRRRPSEGSSADAVRGRAGLRADRSRVSVLPAGVEGGQLRPHDDGSERRREKTSGVEVAAEQGRIAVTAERERAEALVIRGRAGLAELLADGIDEVVF